MMYSRLNYNGQLYDDIHTPIFSPQNRAFSYADALFETIRIEDRQVPLLEFHLDRLSGGMKAFGYDNLDRERINNELFRTIPESTKHLYFKARLSIFRSEGGIYAPTKSTYEFVIVVSQIQPTLFEENNKNFIFFDKYPLLPTEYSQWKRTDALPYVLAGKYKNQHEADEVILLNTYGRVAEAGSSNIFVLSACQSYWKTPPLSEGCIGGVMRKFLLQNKEELDIDIREEIITKYELEQTKGIFVCNAVQLVKLIKATNSKVKSEIKSTFNKSHKMLLKSL